MDESPMGQWNSSYTRYVGYGVGVITSGISETRPTMHAGFHTRLAKDTVRWSGVRDEGYIFQRGSSLNDILVIVDCGQLIASLHAPPPSQLHM